MFNKKNLISLILVIALCVCSFSACSLGKKAYTREGDYIYFGSYPQSEVTDGALKESLFAKAGSTDTWTSYDYYIEDCMSSFMCYKDVEIKGDKYRGVYFTSFRPNIVRNPSSEEESFQDDNGYSTKTIYWFKFEPIKWKILSEEDGVALIMSEMIIDSQDYSHHTGDNPYQSSTIRSWLNSTFLNTAFSSKDQSIINTTKVDNSALSMKEPDDNYASADTDDKIFFLSYKEATNTSFGFSGEDLSDVARKKSPTAYAKSQGVYDDATFGYYWLRSPYLNGLISYIDESGYIGNASPNRTFLGVAPALKITL